MMRSHALLVATVLALAAGCGDSGGGGRGAGEDQVRDLAAVLGVQYRRLPDGNFSHTSSIVLLDRAGAIDTRLDDTAQPVESLVARARAIAAMN